MKRSLSIIVIALILVGATLVLFSDWFKYSFTGNVIQSGFTCGKYSLVTPVAVSASSASSGKQAANAVDGSTGTAWISAKDAASWVHFDMGTRRCVNGLNVFVGKTYVPLTANVYVSNDASNWKLVRQGFSMVSGERYLRLYFPAESARYVRFYFNAGQDSATSTGTGPKTFFGTVSEIKLNVAQLIPVAGSGASGASGGSGADTRDLTGQPGTQVTNDLNRQPQQGGGGGGGGDQANSESGGGRIVTSPVVKNDVPVSVVKENQTPEVLPEVPKVVDEKSNLWWWLLLLLVAGMIVFFFFYYKKRREDQKDINSYKRAVGKK